MATGWWVGCCCEGPTKSNAVAWNHLASPSAAFGFRIADTPDQVTTPPSKVPEGIRSWVGRVHCQGQLMVDRGEN